MSAILVFVSVLLLFICSKCASVAEVDTHSIGGFLLEKTDKKILNFHAPYCQHCRAFAPAYEQLARSSRMSKVLMGSVDISLNQALVSWFKIESIPSIYVFVGSSVYQYNGPHDADHLAEYVRSSYRKDKPLNMMQSPLGPVGLFKGVLICTGDIISSIPSALEEQLELSPMLSYIVFGVILLFCAVFILLLIVIWALFGAEKPHLA